MNYQRALQMQIRGHYGQANVLTVPRPLVDFTGSLTGGIFLSQLLYWSERTNDPEGWFYKSYEEWDEEICVKEKAIRRYANHFHEQGFLETKVKRTPKGDPTVHYRLDFDLFTEAFAQFLEARSGQKAETTPSNGGNESADSPSSPLVHRLHTETTYIETDLHLVDSLGMVPGGPEAILENEGIASPDPGISAELPLLVQKLAESQAVVEAGGPLVEQVQPVRNVPIDDDGNPLNPEGYDRRDPLFLEIMRHMIGTPGNLESKPRLMWMYLYRRAAEDPVFLEFMQIEARLNHGRWHFPGFYDRMRNNRLFERYKRDGVIADESDLDRLLEDDRLKLAGQMTVTVRPAAYDVDKFRAEQQEQWTDDPSLAHLRLSPEELEETED